MDLKRVIVKYCRDKVKSKYEKDEECYICGTSENLQLHHFNTVSILLTKWLAKKHYLEEDVLEWRDEFIMDHYKELTEEVITLCKYHHNERLHCIYGRDPGLATANKQKRWCDIQRDKYYGKLAK